MSRRASRWADVGMIFAMLTSAGCVVAPVPFASDQAVPLSVHEGQTVPVAGTDLVIRVAAVTDFTAQGCHGGPIGCRDVVLLEVKRGAQTQTVALYRPQTALQGEQGIHEARVLGYAITLADLRGKDVILYVRRAG